MSETRKLLLELLEQDPETKPLAPVLRVLVDIPDGMLAEFLRLSELWVGLRGVRRALLIKTLNHELKVGQVARLAGVHRCTLSRNEEFQNLLGFIKSGRLESGPRGYKSADGDIDSFLDEDDDDATDAWD